VNEYRSGEVTLCHFDMYRITSEEDLISIGFFDYTDCMIAVEWSENIPYALPEHYYRVTLTKLVAAEGEYDSGKRKILVEEMKP
jgi:tRNA threonylcarbamoyladenosine biosynthesis protein TsaE